MAQPDQLWWGTTCEAESRLLDEDLEEDLDNEDSLEDTGVIHGGESEGEGYMCSDEETGVLNDGDNGESHGETSSVTRGRVSDEATQDEMVSEIILLQYKC